MSDTPIFDEVNADLRVFEDEDMADLDRLVYVQLRPRTSLLRKAWDKVRAWWQ